MHQTGTQFMAIDRQTLGLQRNLSDAFAVVLRHAFGNTPGPVSKAINQDPRAVRNALEGKAGTPIITHALQARQKAHDDHYDLALGILALIFGETLDEYEERKLSRIIEGNAHAISTLEARRMRRRELRSLPSPDNSGLDRRRA